MSSLSALVTSSVVALFALLAATLGGIRKNRVRVVCNERGCFSTDDPLDDTVIRLS